MRNNLWAVRLVRTDAEGFREQIDARVIPSPQAAGPAMSELRSLHLPDIRKGAELVVEPSFTNEAGIDDWALVEDREALADAQQGQRPFRQGDGPELRP